MVDKQVISAIHAQFRQLRNGEVVDNLAMQGITYRIAWGLESYHLREIAKTVVPSLELAEYLWNEDVRESKMLATRLFPANEVSVEKALKLIEEARYVEIADQLCMNLFSRMPLAKQLAKALATTINDEALKLYSGIKLATRIELKDVELSTLSEELINGNAPMFLKTAALWYKQIYEES